MSPADDLRVTPPAERAVVGCILREPAWAADEAAGLLRPADFMGYVERLAFEAAQALVAAGVRPEPTAVYERLRTGGHGGCVGGDPVRLVQWLGETLADTPTAVNLAYFAGLVREAGASWYTPIYPLYSDTCSDQVFHRPAAGTVVGTP